MKTAAQWLQDTLGYECRDPALLEAALTHRSAGGPHYERLEFLGDAILNCVVAMLVFREFASADEGELSRFRASLVSGDALAVIAAEIQLGEQLRLGSGELKSGGFRRKSILADALEALFGAIYLDGGFEAAERVIERLFAPRLDRLPSAAELKDPKTRLQEALQARGLPLPVYQVESTFGQAHNQSFEVSCSVKTLGLKVTASGPSRRRAEQAAAQLLLSALEGAEQEDKPS
ncbi:MAG TPA: ribonuclease III [Steroidobacter sp.]|nr:ribonuclease III [Steroidobacteraceae bacterium]HLS82805.1 ribonuclease III [Steroidobacter sp.]